MTVGDLRRIIKDLPDTALIYERRYSDFGLMNDDIIRVEEVVVEVTGNDGWGRLVKNKKILSKESLSKVQKVLVFWGN